MIRKLLFALGITLLAPMMLAEDFAPKDGADSALQSRTFDNREPGEMFGACIAILQDINFQISQADIDSGLIVANNGSGLYNNYYGHNHVITIHLSKAPDRSDSTRVRISATHPGGPVLDYSKVYQDFFIHLDRELFREQQR